MHNRGIGVIHEPDRKTNGLSGYRLISGGHDNPDPGFPAGIQQEITLHIVGERKRGGGGAKKAKKGKGGKV